MRLGDERLRERLAKHIGNVDRAREAHSDVITHRQRAIRRTVRRGATMMAIARCAVVDAIAFDRPGAAMRRSNAPGARHAGISATNRGCGKRARATHSVSAAAGDASRTLEYMVEMRCGKCVAKVEAAVSALPGTVRVESSLGANTVTVRTSDAASDVSRAIESCGYNVRLIGQGDADAFGDALAAALGTDVRTLRQSLAAVAEFKGDKYGHGTTKGTVRFVQVNEDTILAEATLDGLSPGEHAICVHASGDITRGIASVGDVYEDSVGVVGVVVADAAGSAKMPSTILNSKLKVWDIIGRSVGVHASRTPAVEGGIAAVLARSAGVGENHKKLCQCDGTVIWEAGEDFLPVKVEESNVNGGALLSKNKVTARRGGA